jgi:hypothetical protein
MSKTNIWLELPPHMQPPEVTKHTKLYRRLLKEVPGMKCGARSWFDTFEGWLKDDLGFVQSRIDKCVFLKFLEGKLVMYLTIHVDDGHGGGMIFI